MAVGSDRGCGLRQPLTRDLGVQRQGWHSQQSAEDDGGTSSDAAAAATANSGSCPHHLLEVQSDDMSEQRLAYPTASFDASVDTLNPLSFWQVSSWHVFSGMHVLALHFHFCFHWHVLLSAATKPLYALSCPLAERVQRRMRLQF